MLGTVDPQGSLLGVEWLLAPLFEGDDDSFYARLAARGDEVISDVDFAGCYAAGRGRPSIPPSLLMRAVLCQIRDDVSDREAARRAAKDLDWKRALGLQADEIPFHHTTLSVFRSRLLVNDADGVVLDRTIQRAVEAGLFGKKVLAIADSTGVMGAAAVADTYELIRQGISRLVVASGGPRALPAPLGKRARTYAGGKAGIDWSDAAARRQELARLVGMARELLTATEGWEQATEAWELLARIVDQDIDEPGDGGGPAIRRGVAKDRVVSVVDPDMRHGRKTSSRRIDGFKAHLLTDHDSELVLGVSVTPANAPDGPQAAPLVETARRAGIPVEEMLGDTAYGDGDTRVAVENVGAKVSAKAQPPAATGRFPKTQFLIDLEGPSATCPAGHTTTRSGWSQDQKGRRVIDLTFGAGLCGPCSLREHCTTSAQGRSITLNFHEARLQAARTDQTRPSTRRKLRRRAVIERKIAEAKRHGMGKARYRGTRKVLLQQRFLAALLNLKRLFTLLDLPGGVQVA